MNTKRRGKKNKDIIQQVSQVWNSRLNQLIKERYGSQKMFASAYKEKYGTGNQADVSRWVNVGFDGSKEETIGFPSYDNMKRIADFLEVTVGYLTGETDYRSFEMEQICEFLGIDEATGIAIERITKLKDAIRFEKYEKTNYKNALCSLLTAKHFEKFIGGICEYAEAVYLRDNPVDYFNTNKVKSIRPEVMDIALKYRDVSYDNKADDPALMTDEVLEAIDILTEAESKAFEQELNGERNVKLAKYELQERYFRLIEELIKKANLGEIRAHYYERFASIAELKKSIDVAISE